MINDLLAYARVGDELALVRTPLEPMVAEIVSDLGAAAADATVARTAWTSSPTAPSCARCCRT